MLPDRKDKKKIGPVGISGIVDQLVTSLGLAGTYYGWQAVTHWPEMVGEHYARHTEALRFQDGVLYVAVDDASWRQRLAMDLGQVLNIIRSSPHGRAVKEIRLVRGEKGFNQHAG